MKMKTNYIQPTTTVVATEQTQMVCSSLTSVSTNLSEGDEIKYGGGSGTQAARVKGNAVDWDEWGE